MKDIEEAQSPIAKATIDIDLSSLIDEIGKEVNCMPITLSAGDRIKACLSTGMLTWDLLVGGGYGKGRWTNIFGPEASGKSTAVYHAIEAALKRGCRVLHFGFEAGDDPHYMKQVGIPLDDMEIVDQRYKYFQPDTGEQAYRLISKLLNRLPDSLGDDPPSILIVLDSLAAMQTENEDEDKSPMAGPARMHSTYIRMIKTRLSKKGCVVLAVNQTRQNPGAYGNPEYEPGGSAVKFYPDTKIRVQMIGGASASNVEEEGGYQYRYVKFATTKNKQYSPFQTCDEYRIRLGKGYDPIYDTYQYLKFTGQCSMTGTWYILAEIFNDESGPVKFQWKKGSSVLETSRIRDICWKQLQSGEAFKMYWEQKGIKAGQEIPAPSTDDEIENEDDSITEI